MEIGVTSPILGLTHRILAGNLIEHSPDPGSDRAELDVPVRAVELSIVVVGQKRPVDQRPIVDAGLEEIRKRIPWERGRAIVHLSGLRNMFSDGDEGGHSPSSSAPCRAHGA